MRKTLDHIQPISLQLIKKFEPKSSWLRYDSAIHGVDHMARVFILQELLCNQLEAQGVRVNREAVRWAAMAHDVGRVDDGLDLEHGRMSALWIKENLSSQMSPELLDTVTYIVHWHVPSDSEAPVMTTELKVLKDADALDRVRLGDLNSDYLRTEAAHLLIDVARDLYHAYLHTDSNDSFSAVIAAARDVGVVAWAEESRQGNREMNATITT